MRSQKGFSLIELMTVVAIAGILAAIAVPNFQRFQAKSRQSEAKTSLGSLYTSELAFYSEWRGFYGSMQAVGYAPPPGATAYYEVGFTNTGPAPDGLPAIAVNDANTRYFNDDNPGLFIPCWSARLGCGSDPEVISAPWGSAPTGPAFAAIAISYNINGSGAADVWQIDQTNTLQQISSGL